MPGAIRLIALAAVTLVAPGVAQAQTPGRCSYDDCALRIEGDLVVQGSEGESVGSLRNTRILGLATFPERAAPYLLEFEDAVHSAARWNRAERVFEWIGAGAGVFVLAALPFGRAEDALQVAVPVGALSSAGALIMGGVSERRTGRAELSLSRAIWWYNRQLRR